MKNKLMRLLDLLLSRKRSIIETIKTNSKTFLRLNIRDTDSEAVAGTPASAPLIFANVLCGLIAYCHQPKKPSLQLEWLLPPYL
jgi:hypothetical protein